jgi:hypothetical protein
MCAVYGFGISHISLTLREWRSLYVGRGRESILLKGTQAIPARPSDKDRIRVKTLGWWVVKLETETAEFCFHEFLLNAEIMWKVNWFSGPTARGWYLWIVHSIWLKTQENQGKQYRDGRSLTLWCGTLFKNSVPTAKLTLLHYKYQVVNAY